MIEDHSHPDVYATYTLYYFVVVVALTESARNVGGDIETVQQ
jgi:hypothetical protein